MAAKIQWAIEHKQECSIGGAVLHRFVLPQQRVRPKKCQNETDFLNNPGIEALWL